MQREETSPLQAKYLGSTKDLTLELASCVP